MASEKESGEQAQRSKTKQTWKALPEVWALIKPRRGILAAGFVLMGINRVAGLVLPASTKYLLDDVFLKHQVHLLKSLVGIVLLATVVQGLTSFILTQLLSKSAQRLIADLRRRVQAHVGRLPVAFYDANKTGALVSRIMSDVEGVRNLIGTGLVELAGGLMTAVIALGYLLHVSVRMTAVACAVLLVFGLAVTESLGGVRVVKGYHAEEREEKVFSGGVQRLLENVLKTLTATSLMSLSASVLMGLVSAMVFLLGGRQVISGGLTPGTFVSYTIFLGLLVAPVVQIVAYGTQVTEALAGLERTREILNEKPEDETPDRDTVIERIQGRVLFEHVDFAYEPGKPVLYDVNFQAEPGTVTALVGPSGAGKSTIIGLIAAFYTPTSGRVLVDGIDLAKVKLESYRTQLGVVLQETFLFDGTIRENVAFARPEAGEGEILAACRIARVDEFAESFEKKYETVVGERGVKLSGGQKQRVSIARAILADPRILILDEATSSLDSESEALIQEGLRYLMRGRTTFVIAHRLSTIRGADQILVVEGGRIIERGTHESLYAAAGRYYDLYTKQHGIEANLFLAPGEGEAELEVARTELAEPGQRNTRDSALADAIRLIRGRDN